ncbi:hypothetical protein LTR99_010400 [Exophiala xenobiotica]|uniref:Ketoreductase domain-containing protein n=1 Tax=Vermiconidia calcicola TaxID=1690605 RepID=A0AAV9Q357_9PEZI|nr:hypothetical protein LTR72_007753 [Exophiala xenobiotica]KAK5530263.1 hypothetical protein LTR23_010421 [Chaetothyriales sp. CCFEE 6169]KAK5534118.1 hypothetical protein LTR25_007098 [Vermiconidia calcicola]KAK5226486.1 hypothetical protein LTR47_008943 [Exophiala xenobiotica]KAK5244213.1 hypothetical protein LTS06_010166 [Exophiala xenobiotica]
MAEEVGANIPPIKIYPDKYENQVVVITGAAQGIGEVSSKLFASQGATVVMVDIQEEKLKKVEAEIKNTGGKATYRLCNIGKDTEVKSMIDEIVSTWEKIDVLIHFAAVYPFIPLEVHSTEDYHRIMNVNIDSTFFLARAVLPHMQKAGYGRIINTSSGTLQLPDRGLSVYVASKAAVVGFTRSLAVEAGPGVTANIILPGLIRTDAVWNNHVQPDGSHRLFDMLIQKQCVKRHGRPQDIAHTVNFIASPESQFITGQIFDCGGGATFH